MTARIAAAWPRCSGWVTPRPVRLRKVHRRAGDRYAADRDERGRCGTPLSFDILTPTLRESAARLAERARAENWSHEEKYLAACLQREVSARESHGEEGRIRAARVPARKSLEECDFDQSSPPTKPLAVGAKCSAMTSWPPPTNTPRDQFPPDRENRVGLRAHDAATFLFGHRSIHRNTRSHVYVEVMLARPLRVRRRHRCSPSAG